MIKKICKAQSRKEVRSLLEGHDIRSQFIYLENAVDVLNKEIETDIRMNYTDVAIWKMSHVVMLEDELLAVERVILKSSLMKS